MSSALFGTNPIPIPSPAYGSIMQAGTVGANSIFPVRDIGVQNLAINPTFSSILDVQQTPFTPFNFGFDPYNLGALNLNSPFGSLQIGGNY